MSSLDMALIGNCTIGALIDAQAKLVWGCFPRFDGDPVFCALLKESEDDGFFAIELADCKHTEQHYLENTAILVTRLYDDHDGVVEVTDFAPRFGQFGRTFRPMMLVRRIVRLSGSPRLKYVGLIFVALDRMAGASELERATAAIQRNILFAGGGVSVILFFHNFL